MTDDRAARLALISRAFHVVDIAVMVALVVSVAAFNKPSWLLFFVAPTALLSVAIQLMAFRAEAGDDVRIWHAGRERWEREQNQGQ